MWIRDLFNALTPWRSQAPVQTRHPGVSRGSARSFKLAVEALEDRAMPASLSVGDVMIREGASGTENAVVSVTLSAPIAKTVTVNYNTANGTALAGSDYNAVSGKLTFARGEISKSILVPIRGDRLVEPDETFLVKLSGAKGANIADGRGVVTIVNDDASLPTISISDASVWEPAGPWGYETLMTFTVSLSAAHDEAITVNFATQDNYYAQDGIATPGLDYEPTSGTLTFAPGETTKTITVKLWGDPNLEYNETFGILLFGASANATIDDDEGLGIIAGEWGNVDPSIFGDLYTTY